MPGPDPQIPRIAVFDVDWTLLEGTSAETQLLGFLIGKRMLRWRYLLHSLARLVFFLPLGVNRAVLKNRYYMRGIPVESIRGLMPEFFDARLGPRLSRTLVQRMEDLKKQGCRIYLVSGTLDFILDILIRKLGADGGLCSRLEVKDGKLTGKIIGPYPYYKGKITILNELLGGRAVDFPNSVAFGDTWADIPLLSLFGHPVAVHPDFFLKWHARARGWEIVSRKAVYGPWLMRFWLNHLYRRP
ncbi:HAD-IB family hydrolase [bacterium]|nr:HAD-IB family hydrolase [bacterium]